MGKLNTKKEYPDQQQEKHDAYLKEGFKLVATRKISGVVRRLYAK